MTALIENIYDPALVEGQSSRFIILTGCSGGGKSALLSELAKRGFDACEEPGRQLVKEQLYIGGDALPWQNLSAFIDLTISRSINFMIEAAKRPGVTFFDRGIIDQISGAAHAGLEPKPWFETAARRFRYNETVFAVPPWREIYQTDSERQHGFDDAVASYEALIQSYSDYGYRVVTIPKTNVEDRADFLLKTISNRDSMQ
ncbi:AAA family ATPase [Agrobacterium sp. AGB01]|uniref:AAA family ATPase n=1 Tax=Agrobacterium sp. AGB01 TaxID=2769302 RepID=UPI001783EBD3|nr:AAA family ATPase [Agrobacterium sp. AGB01]MBD9386662.1 AAA family ATPase [Agrobacterium sp. AGB01]